MLAVPHGGLSEGIRGLLATRFDSVVLVADEGSLLACLAALRPEIVVLDLALAPGVGGGMDLAARMRSTHPGPRILLLVVDDDAEFTRAAIAAGVDGCLLKESLGQDLLPAVAEVLGGGTAFWSSEVPDPRHLDGGLRAPG